MKCKLCAYLNNRKDNKLYSAMFYKYYDCLGNGLSEEESYNQAMSVIDDCR